MLGGPDSQDWKVHVLEASAHWTRERGAEAAVFLLVPSGARLAELEGLQALLPAHWSTSSAPGALA